MKTFIINLGMGNSRFESIQDKAARRMSVHDQVSMLAGMTGVKMQYEWSEGQYEGKLEETMVITADAQTEPIALDFAMQLVKAFTQECVALYSVERDQGLLVWSDKVTTRKYAFDPKYFLLPMDTRVRERILSRLAKA